MDISDKGYSFLGSLIRNTLHIKLGRGIVMKIEDTVLKLVKILEEYDVLDSIECSVKGEIYVKLTSAYHVE